MKANFFVRLTRHLENDRQRTITCSPWEEVQAGVAGPILAFATHAEVKGLGPGHLGPCHSERREEATREEVLRMWACAQIVTWLG